jgi:RNA polymerase sigma-70 factor (ECF subfamily)
MPDNLPIMPEAPATEAEISLLIAQAQKDPVGIAAIYDRFIEPVYSYIYSRVMDAGTAEDLAASTFLNVLEELPHYIEQSQFNARLYSIAGSIVADHIQSNTSPSPAPYKRKADTTPEPLVETPYSKEVRRLSGLVQELDEERLELLRLRYIAGLSFSEIGSVLGRSEEAVKKALSRVTGALQQQLETENE